MGSRTCHDRYIESAMFTHATTAYLTLIKSAPQKNYIPVTSSDENVSLLKSDAIKVIGNLSFQCPSVQNEVRVACLVTISHSRSVNAKESPSF